VLSVAPSPLGDFAVSGGGDQTVRLWHLPSGRLVLSIFRSGADWVAFTPEGYYAASPQGDRLVGWQLNRGEGKNPENFLASQFQKSLYRPDVIQLLLQTGDAQKAADLANEKLGKTNRDLNISKTLPPAVRIVAPENGKQLDDEAFFVSAVAESRGSNPVTAMQLIVDGRPFEGQKGRQKFDAPKLGSVKAEWKPALPPGPHRIAVQAESAVSKALSREISITSAGADPLEKPALYILSIGVAAYKNDELRLNYSAQDAIAVERTFREKSASLYRKIESKVITDAQATEREIRRGLSWFQQQMTSRDVGVVFFSGHGQKDSQGIFYLLPVDVDTNDLASTGVPEERLKSTIAGTPGRVMVLLDACHAGSYSGDKRKAASVALTDDLARDLINDDFGTIVFCSSMGREFSLESNEHRQSYFTLALTEGLSGKADSNNDSTVYLHELKFYITERIKELTKGQQHPVLSESATIRSFPLAVK
jgi:hypothetical protein